MRPILVIALLAAASVCAFWAVSAQEGGRLFAPPPVLPIEEPPKKTEPIFPKNTKPLYDKKLAPPELPAPIPVDAPARKTDAAPMNDAVPLPVLPPPVLGSEPKGPTLVVPPVLPELEPKALPAPLPEPSKALIVELPAKSVMAPPDALPLTTPVPQPGAPSNGVKSFVPIRSAGSKPLIAPPLVESAPSFAPKIVPPLTSPPSIGALASVQVPSIAVEKRGDALLRSGDGQVYQIVVRNHGTSIAQQVRIEDEMPANARMIYAEPIPAIDGQRATWTIVNLAAGAEQTLRFQLRSPADVEVQNRITVQVLSGQANAATTTIVQRPRPDLPALAVQVAPTGPLTVGKPAVFEIRVANQSQLPLTGIVLYGTLPDGVQHPDSQEIKGEVDGSIAPGEVKTLNMPTTAVKPGRWTVAVKVTANGGHEATANAEINIATADALQLQQAPTTRMFLGRSGDFRIEVANNTNKPLKNLSVADRLPEGLEFVTASDRGLYQANSRTVHWLLDLAPGAAKTLIVRVHGNKMGQHQNIVQAKADGIGETSSVGIIQLDGVSDLSLRVAARDQLIEVGKEWDPLESTCRHASLSIL